VVTMLTQASSAASAALSLNLIFFMDSPVGGCSGGQTIALVVLP
jgi:hypothetical protein